MSRASRNKAPWDDKSIEIWSLNKAWRDPTEEKSFVKRWDRWFEIHSLSTITGEFLDRDEKMAHIEWLKRDHGNRPIYMAEAYPWFPNAVRYPLEAVVGRFGSYFTSSMAYMIGLALMIPSVKRIECYGFEMIPENVDYAYQIPCIEYYRGLAKGLGIEIAFPDVPTIWNQPLYAYQDLLGPYKQAANRRTILLKNTELRHRLAAMGHLAKVEFCQELAEVPDLKASLDLLKKREGEEEHEFRKEETLMNMAIAGQQDVAYFKGILSHYPTWTLEDQQVGVRMAEEGANDVSEVKSPESP
jgi:hypothetical protein